MEAESGECGDVRSLVEHVQISEGELLSDGLGDFEDGLVVLLVAVVVTKLD